MLLDYLGSDECHEELEKLVLDIQDSTYGATALLLVAFGVGMFKAIKKKPMARQSPP